MAGRQYPNIYRTICRRIQSTKSAFFVQGGGLSVPVNKQQVQRGVRGLLGRSASASGLHPRNLASRICPCNKLSIYSFFQSLYFYSLFFSPCFCPLTVLLCLLLAVPRGVPRHYSPYCCCVLLFLPSIPVNLCFLSERFVSHFMVLFLKERDPFNE